ncbi:glycosyl transferase family 2 [Caldicellulosiruptor bescii]|jgi:glycosyltransferase involved in cell wall biosynthesis|uniref:Glycosyl transferase family 2 n=2 Tax=Caldicellulosiruptor bescii TaxID=31899 RepID=B9MM77_CALBD|nr:glycosyltransferase family 2 protein [Caldicellulosiruptor bescii]ACM59309.1 glycosyl transferase family 2 [Caldicellulosiruptor bescii DSM 6725]PBC88235.1 glycosyl transferase family 2 [Caldicellulosiruptor bescii]PBC92284.1 glycosyl transferase family 2 [Caldicellulosiruptor bescii]PBD04905.1 glycosyl transferase family 2 [Caldicellulosiruptor bescii]PBD05465.1 glycosyl transferase family 2 [Caldicellulosiruptor bescii]
MKLGILITTYNDDYIILRCLDSIYNQLDEIDFPIYVVCVDDGSDLPLTYPHFDILRTEHRGRSYARIEGLKKILAENCTHFLFLDSDMVLPPGFLKKLKTVVENYDSDAFIIPEVAFSSYNNFWTKVKVFERNLYRVSYCKESGNIEAARLWKTNAFPGFVEGLEAFEEIQPTILGVKKGLKILKIQEIFILHDEKKVTFKDLIRKKNTYFCCMIGSEKCSKWEIMKRYYFFRPHLYHKENLKKYIRHPILAIGVVFMYLVLTLNFIWTSISINLIRKGLMEK